MRARWNKIRSCAIWTKSLRCSALLVLCLSLLTTAGCRGCRLAPSAEGEGQKSEEELKKLAEEKKKKDDLEIGPLLPLYGQQLLEDDDNAKPMILAKPGHWTPTVQKMQANYDDFVGRASTTIVDTDKRPLALAHTSFTYESTRPVVLAKGREKLVESQLFLPEDVGEAHVRARLLNRNSGVQVHETAPFVLRMPSYQYLLVVLAKEPSRYGFLKVTDTVRAEWEEEDAESSQFHYQVLLADANERIALSPSLFSWTSLAYLVWDEVDVDRFSPEQQRALVDWIHWGGRLIVNGPDSLDTLRGSFLDKYLPAENSGSRSISTDELRKWSKYWTTRSAGKPLPPLSTQRSLSGVDLALREGARDLAGGGRLFLERNVGRGSIVVSALQLSQRELINWPGFDCFLNAALLGRPPRKFSEGPFGGLRVDWAGLPERRLDAHFTTGLRLFARDAGAPANIQRVESTYSGPFGNQLPALRDQIDRPGGLASWNEFGPVSSTSRETLLTAAGVEMPGAGFIIGCLAMYLVVLVPLNWMVFHTLGRVEWAWIAAPLIAVLGTLAIVRMAQLDIGFVRSQTEIALLELQAEHPRGLLSRYTAFYSSLSTTYDIDFDQSDTVSTPLPIGEDNDPKIGNSLQQVSFEQTAQAELRGLTVSSNSTRMLHTEQIIELAGPLRLGMSSRNQQQVENHSGLNLRNVVVVHRYFQSDDERPLYAASWIGGLRSGASAVLGLTSLELSAKQLPFAEQRKLALRGRPAQQMNIDDLLKLAYQFSQANDPRDGRREEYRLVGQIDEVLPGSTATPDASQIQGVTVVLAHLAYGAPPPAQPDVNSRADVKIKNPGLFDD